MNHDSNMPLGRTGAGTLRLQKDDRGLNVDLTVDDEITFANDLIRVVRRGDAVGGSFSFARHSSRVAFGLEAKAVASMIALISAR